MDTTEFTDFLSRSFRLLARHSADGAIHFVFMDWRHIAALRLVQTQTFFNSE